MHRWKDVRIEISYAFLAIRITADGKIIQYIENLSVRHLDNREPGTISSSVMPLPPVLLRLTSSGGAFAGSICVCLSDTTGGGGLVEELVKRVSRVSKEYNLLIYRNSIMTYWDANQCPGQHCVNSCTRRYQFKRASSRPRTIRSCKLAYNKSWRLRINIHAPPTASLKQNVTKSGNYFRDNVSIALTRINS